MRLPLTRISLSGSRRLLGEIGTAVLVLVVATAGILFLRGQQADAQAHRLEIQKLETSLSAHSAIEWHAIADGRLSQEVRERATELDERIRLSIVSLSDGHVARMQALSLGVDQYLAATAREFEFIARKDIEAAREVDETGVDPAFEAVEELVVVIDRALANQAEASSSNADIGTIGIAAAALLALLFLGLRIVRAERAVAREAALATARAEREEELRHALKMEAVGLLAGGIAHDFNNLLTIVSGYGELVAHELGSEHPCHDAITSVLGAADRASDLTHQLLAFGGKQTMAPTQIELGSVCEKMLQLLAGAAGADVVVAVDVIERVDVLADSSQLEQVLLNLVVNGRDAMPDGGRIDISVGECVFETELKLRAERLPAGRYAELVVKDTGSGIDEETLSHIFDPYFTTKGPKGHGLGLASVSGIVAQSGGIISVESVPGLGTEFHVYLPALTPIRALAGDPEEELAAV
jgi:signal transduction histidine kinase